MDKSRAAPNQINNLPEQDAPDASFVTDAACCAKSPGRPKAADLEARLTHLVHTAGYLFLQKGYSKVSLETIAREAHVAVRTIYVKFGGKPQLLKAVLAHKRASFFPDMGAMERDTRPFREVIDEFAQRMWKLVRSPGALAMHRMVAAEARFNPELAETFYQNGPGLTRAMLEQYFARPDIRAQMYPDTPFEQLPAHLINSVIGDFTMHLLFDEQGVPEDEQRRQLQQRVELFYRSVLPPA
ncbi:TetR/AcrR family transcriptional regulator [Massilia arenosa]|uniref:TetR/AcrR family transcriptional regulator n=1 Tax=Zemynaea arenosa TaxID=2561931 RepID=A0A4Y9RQJ8_9BURK|nr:TetR/AcrR family transcriptional regulator [Massilia arenosa]